MDLVLLLGTACHMSKKYLPTLYSKLLYEEDFWTYSKIYEILSSYKVFYLSCKGTSSTRESRLFETVHKNGLLG